MAVVDGHGKAGKAAAAFVEAHLEGALPALWEEETARAGAGAPPAPASDDASAHTQDDAAVRALRRAFIAADQALSAEPDIETSRSGCTATVAVFARGRLAVACAGDCRCVLGKVGLHWTLTTL